MSEITQEKLEKTKPLCIFLSKQFNLQEDEVVRKLEAVYFPYAYPSANLVPRPSENTIDNDNSTVFEKKLEAFSLLGNQFPKAELRDSEIWLNFEVSCKFLDISSKFSIKQSEFKISFQMYREFMRTFHRNRDFIRNAKTTQFIEDWLTFPVFVHIQKQIKIDFKTATIMSGGFSYSLKFLYLLFLHFRMREMIHRFLNICFLEEGIEPELFKFPKIGLFLCLVKYKKFFEIFLRIFYFLSTFDK